MNIQNFTILLENTMDKAMRLAGGADAFMNSYSCPAADLVQLYGPLTDRSLKERAQIKAQELYDVHKDKTDFRRQVQMLGSEVSNISLQPANGAVTSMGALLHLSRSFSVNLQSVLDGIKDKPSTIAAVLLFGADTSISVALSTVPIAGPFFAYATRGVPNLISTFIGNRVNAAASGIRSGSGGAAAAPPSAASTSYGGAFAAGLEAAAPTIGKTYGDAASNFLESMEPDGTLKKFFEQPGVASLLYTGLKAIQSRDDRRILMTPDSDARSFARIMEGKVFSQNQSVAACMNDFERIGLRLPQSPTSIRVREKLYQSNEATLEGFAILTSLMFAEFFDLLVNVINTGVQESFKEATSRLKTEPDISEDQKIAILIIGYFYSKDWDGARARERLKMIQLLEEERDTEIKRRDCGLFMLASNAKKSSGIALPKLQGKVAACNDKIEYITQDIALAGGKHSFKALGDNIPAGTSASIAYQKGRDATSRLNFIVKTYDGDLNIAELDQVCIRASTYFRSLKSALCADIETAMRRGNKGFLTDEHSIQMWKLFIGSVLITNHALNDSKIKFQSGRARKLLRAINPTTDATYIPDHYVSLIEQAGFIERTSGNWRYHVSTSKKKEMAARGNLRWSTFPSDRERAMLITFCSTVAFTLDIGRISLGFLSWDEAKKGLHEMCTTISATAYTH